MLRPAEIDAIRNGASRPWPIIVGDEVAAVWDFVYDPASHSPLPLPFSQFSIEFVVNDGKGYKGQAPDGTVVESEALGVLLDISTGGESVLIDQRVFLCGGVDAAYDLIISLELPVEHGCIPFGRLGQKIPIFVSDPRYQGQTDIADKAALMLGVLRHVLTFLSARNVVLDPAPSGLTRQQRRQMERQAGVIDYRVLTVRANGERHQLTHLSRSPEEPGGFPAHLVRGHFKHYTAEAPLFGKYTGTYYWPPHVRGNIENGAVVKDYYLEAG